TEFKQIIGRGTRVREDYGKEYFTIMDFRNVTRLFADKDFDGEPVQIFEPKPSEPPIPPDEPTDSGDGTGEEEPPIVDGPFTGGDGTGDTPKKYYVNGVDVNVINERVQYLDHDGKLITESLKDYSKKSILRKYASLDEFLNSWNSAEKKKAIIEELEQQGVFLNELEKETSLKDLDAFDLICHIAYDTPPLTRRERINNIKKRNYFTKYGEKARNVLNALLEKYSEEGIEHIEDIEILNVQPFETFGTPVQILNDIFGGRDQYLRAVKELEHYLYL
ncbi:MAG: restriction endonuclease, partial [Patescibacteria group bacterium]|nr:restriction endonuclease [Patescibacteria group bacterium]